jgi:2-amino-4-hydroxy-6-hydroxymethyldihydropteridine diphosphokinase
MNKVFLGLGSNIGNREENINSAVERLDGHDFITVRLVSKLIETKAVSKFKQPEYLNGVAKIETILSAVELLQFTNQIEIDMGRQSKGTKDPRTIDIDILLYGTDIVCQEGLTIPHPLMHERLFVLEPLLEIEKSLVHPILQEPIQELVRQLQGY